MPKQVAINGLNPRITGSNAIVNTQFADQTKTKQFVRWFGDSVVTENGASRGRPLIVYHGTNADDFNVFERGDMGFHFGNKEAAESRMEAKGGDRIIEAYIRIAHPLIVDMDIGEWTGSNLADYLANDDPDIFGGIRITDADRA